MSDTDEGRPRGRDPPRIPLHQHHGMGWFFVHTGYISSVAFLFLIGISPLVGDWRIIYDWYYWIGGIYLLLQFLEVISRDQLNMADFAKDLIFSLLPALLSLTWEIEIPVRGPAAEVLNFWTFIAWFDFLIGILITLVILNAPFQRRERETR